MLCFRVQEETPRGLELIRSPLNLGARGQLKFSETAVAKALKPLRKPHSDGFLMTQWKQRQKR